MDIGQARPKLKQDSIFFQGDDGALLKSEQTTFFLRGKTVYAYLAKLRPYLNGENTLESICEGLEDDQRQTIYSLVQTLVERGVVKDCVPEDPDLLTEEVRRRFSRQIDFIDHYADEALARFKKFREARVVVAGGGEPLGHLAAALLRNGLAQVHVVELDGAEPSLEVARGLVDELEADGVPARLTTHAAAVLDQNLRDYDVLAYSGDGPDLRRLHDLNRLCAEHRVRFLPAAVLLGRTMIGPLSEPGVPGCWLCACLRMSANAEPGDRAALWQGLSLGNVPAVGEALPSTYARLMGNAQAFELFKLFGEHLLPETRGGALLQDLELFESYVAQFIPHPLCPVCSQTTPEAGQEKLEQLAAGRHDRELDEESLFVSFDRIRDLNLGLIRLFDDDALTQLPLKSARATFGDPIRPDEADTTLVAFSTDHVLGARCKVMADVVALYSRALPDTRRMRRSSYRDLDDGSDSAQPIAAREFTAWTGLRDIDDRAEVEWLPAWSLGAGELRHVPAAAVFPKSNLNRDGVFERDETGVGVGLSFDEIARCGLLDALGEERLEAALAEPRLVALDAATAKADSEDDLTYLLKTIERLGSEVSLHRVEGDTPVEVVIASALGPGQPRIVTSGIGLSSSEAALSALVRIVGPLGSRSELPELIGKDRDPRLDDILISSSSEGALVPFEDRRVAEDLEGMVTRLAELGRDALMVDLTPSDVWDTGTFLCGVVLLTRDSRQNPI